MMKNDYISDPMADVVDYTFRRLFDVDIDFMDMEVVHYKSDLIVASIRYPTKISRKYLLKISANAGYIKNCIPIQKWYSDAHDLLSYITRSDCDIYKDLFTYLSAAYMNDVKDNGKYHDEDNKDDSIPDLVCYTKCQSSNRCIEKPGGYIHKYYVENGCCPCGNIPKWVVIE